MKNCKYDLNIRISVYSSIQYSVFWFASVNRKIALKFVAATINQELSGKKCKNNR